MLVNWESLVGVLIGNTIIGIGVYPVLTVDLVYLGEISSIKL